MAKNALSKLFNLTEVQLTYKRKAVNNNHFQIKKSSDAYALFLGIWDKRKIQLLEEFKIILLERNSDCIGLSHISVGGQSSCVADPKVIFATALKAKASGIILAHNHPSGNIQPSSADLALTKRLCEGGKVLEVDVLDHLIITPEKYYSMADEGLMP